MKITITVARIMNGYIVTFPPAGMFREPVRYHAKDLDGVVLAIKHKLESM